MRVYRSKQNWVPRKLFSLEPGKLVSLHLSAPELCRAERGKTLQYFGHLMRRVDSLEKTLMLEGIGGRRRRGRQRLDGITVQRTSFPGSK